MTDSINLLTLNDLYLKTAGRFAYLATPYSSPDPEIEAGRTREAMGITASLLERGIVVHSPIISCHEMHLLHGLPGDHNFWWNYNFAFINSCAFLLVAQMPGWKESKGVRAEIRLAKDLDKPIYYLLPASMAVSRDPF